MLENVNSPLPWTVSSLTFAKERSVGRNSELGSNRSLEKQETSNLARLKDFLSKKRNQLQKNPNLKENPSNPDSSLRMRIHFNKQDFNLRRRIKIYT
jgi:hypothetical protein